MLHFFFFGPRSTVHVTNVMVDSIAVNLRCFFPGDWYCTVHGVPQVDLPKNCFVSTEKELRAVLLILRRMPIVIIMNRHTNVLMTTGRWVP